MFGRNFRNQSASDATGPECVEKRQRRPSKCRCDEADLSLVYLDNCLDELIEARHRRRMTGKMFLNRGSKELPRLAFGDGSAAINRNINGYRDTLKQVISSLDCFDSIGRSDEFASKSALIGFGAVRLIAYSNTPLEVRVSSSKDITLLIPIVGSNLSIVDSKEYRWCAGQSGVFLPRTDRRGECGLRSVVAADINFDVLSCTLNAMLGGSSSSI